VLEAAGRGLLCGSAIALALGLVSLALARWPLHLTVLSGLSQGFLHWTVLSGLAAAALLIGPCVGAWFAVRREPDWLAAAAAVDRRYQLHDRTVTAITFLEKAERTPLEELEIADCMERLAQADPRSVVHVGLPRPMPAALLLSVLAVAAIVGPVAVEPSAGTPGEPPAEAATVAKPAEDKLPPDAAAMAARFAAEIKWQAAPSAEVVVNRSNLLVGATLEEVISGADEAAMHGRTDGSGRAGDSERAKQPEIVLEGELLPWEHRRTIRRYFESIRPQEYNSPDKPSAGP